MSEWLFDTCIVMLSILFMIEVTGERKLCC